MPNPEAKEIFLELLRIMATPRPFSRAGWHAEQIAPIYSPAKALSLEN
jgi:hypothetical protein